MRNGNFLKSHGSEICVNQVHINQGFGVQWSFQLANSLFLENQFLDSVHKSFWYQTTLDLRKGKNGVP
jgi:hypothetical protein